MAIHGYTWLYTAIHSYTWLYTAIHGYTWLYNVKDDNPKRIKGKITELVDAIRKEQPTVKIAFSSIVHRTDDRSLNRCIDQVNRSMESFSTQSGVDYISHGNISEDCLNSGGLHLNRKGVFNFASNFRKYLNVHSD